MKKLRVCLTFDDVLLIPKHGRLSKRANADITAELFRNYPIATPIISANMPSVTGPKLAISMWEHGGFSFLPRFNTISEAEKDYALVRDAGAECGVSIGLDDWTRVHELACEGAKIFCLDVAHGDHTLVWSSIDRFNREIRSEFFGVKLVVGNIATARAASAVANHRVDAVKVGIGPGAACRTREVTGFGVPQLTAIMDVAEAIKNTNPEIRVIADGGIRTSGDIVKAIAAGADTVMIGSLFAGCDEAPNPGEYYGNASANVNGHRAPEGIHGQVERKGSVEDVIKELAWGIRSGISYGGATNLEELRQNAEFIQVTAAGQVESHTRLEVIEDGTGRVVKVFGADGFVTH